MSEYIVQVPDEQAEQLMARFGIDGTQVFGFQLTGEIVRCGDCKYCMAYTFATYCVHMAHAVELDGFCAWGERKEGGDD